MNEKPRDSGTRREPKLSSFFHRVSPGKLFGVIFLVHAMKLAAGCNSGPPDGAIGGKCKDNGCNLTCNQGVCDNASDTCIDETSTYNGGSSGGGGGESNCSFTSSPDCEEDEEAFICSNGYSDLSGVVCRPVGGNVYCCDVDAVVDASSPDATEADANDGGPDDATIDASDD